MEEAPCKKKKVKSTSSDSSSEEDGPTKEERAFLQKIAQDSDDE